MKNKNSIILGNLYFAKYKTIYLHRKPVIFESGEILTETPFIVLEQFTDNCEQFYWLKIIQGNRMGFFFSYDEDFIGLIEPWENK